MHHRHLTQLLKSILEDSERPAKQISAEMGIPYSTLMNQLNPDIHNACFKADDLVAFMQALGTVRPLEHLAAEMGFRLVPLSGAIPDKDDICDELLDTYPTLANLHALRGMDVTEHEIKAAAEVHREIDEDVTALCAETTAIRSRKKVA